MSDSLKVVVKVPLTHFRLLKQLPLKSFKFKYDQLESVRTIPCEKPKPVDYVVKSSGHCSSDKLITTKEESRPEVGMM